MLVKTNAALSIGTVLAHSHHVQTKDTLQNALAIQQLKVVLQLCNGACGQKVVALLHANPPVV